MKKYWRRNLPRLAGTLTLSLMAAVLSAGISLILQRAIDVALAGEAAAFLQTFLFALVYVLALCAISVGASLAGKHLSAEMIRQYRQDIFTGVLGRRPAQFAQTPTADYLSALTNDMKLIEENYIAASLRAFEMAALFGATVVLLLRFSPLVAALLLVSFVLMMVLPALIGRSLEKRQAAVSREMSGLTETAKDLFSGYAVLQGFRRVTAAGTWFQAANRRETRAKLRAARLFALSEGLSDTLAVLSTLSVIFVSAYLVLREQLTMGALLALVQLSGSFLSPLVLLLQDVPKIQSVKPVIARLDQYAQVSEVSALPEPSFQNAIVLRDVSFAYTPGVPVLAGVDLTLEKGKKYALLGESGSGKTTLLKLLTGFLEGYQGSITYDGEELRNLDPQGLPRLAAVLQQDITLFRWTLGENIHLREDFPPEAFSQALEKSGVSAFLSEGGLERPVGENGALLSGGQRQRVALARALLRDTPLLILDEGTSALDRETAAALEARLLETPGLTLLTITHKSDLLERYDEIYRLEAGRLAKHPATLYT